MNTQVPPGPENAVAPQEYPQFTAGYAQYPPVQHSSARQHHARRPVSAPPAAYPLEGVPAGDYPAVLYPQEGAAGYPVPVPYPQPSTYPSPSAYSTAPPWATRPADHGAAPAIGPGTLPERPGTPSERPSTTSERAGIPSDHVGAPQMQVGSAQMHGSGPQKHADAPNMHADAPNMHAGAPQEQLGTPHLHAGAPQERLSTPPEPLPQYGGLLVPFPDEMRHASRAQAPAVWPVAVFTMLFGVLGSVSAKRRADQARRTRNSTAPYWIAFLISVAAGAFCWFVFAAVVIVPMLAEIRETNSLEAVQRNVVADGRLKDARIAVTAAQCRAMTDRDGAGMRDYLCQLTLEGGRTGSLALTADESGQWHSEPTR